MTETALDSSTSNAGHSDKGDIDKKIGKGSTRGEYVA
jgi:hypothetical protein